MTEKIEDGEVNITGDLPITELANMANKLVEEGHTVWMKFTCEQCGNRLFFEEPNTFYKQGTCDKCGHLTVIKYGGLLTAFHLGTGLDALAKIKERMNK